jgi:predicted ester cyclase
VTGPGGSGSANALAEQVWAAVFDGRVPELAGLFTADAEMTTSTASVQGIDRIMGVFGRHRDSYPDMKHELLTVVEASDGTMAGREVRFTGTHLGELRNPRTGGVIPATGRTVTWTAAEIVSAADGKITAWHAYFDRMALMEQFTDTEPDGTR